MVEKLRELLHENFEGKPGVISNGSGMSGTIKSFAIQKMI
jgi:hypothetical protein